MAAHIPHDEITKYDLKIWNCEEGILTQWLGNLESYRVVEPERIVNYRPCFPEVKKFEGVKQVEVLYDVPEKGNAANVRVKASDDERFNECAIKAALKQVFRKGYKNGIPARFEDFGMLYSFTSEEQ